jgi:molybdate transport system substrate-binding protein
VKNRLEIAVPKGNPSKITWLADFGALCAQQVPCGAAAKKVFEAAKITGKPDSLEQDVKAALTKVSLGEVDAALVYKTDVQAAAGKVDGRVPGSGQGDQRLPDRDADQSPECDRREGLRRLCPVPLIGLLAQAPWSTLPSRLSALRSGRR